MNVVYKMSIPDQDDSACCLLAKDECLQIELTEKERERLAEPAKLSQFQRQKLDKDAKKHWDLFYKRNGNRFFKNRYWTKYEFPELFQGADGGKKLDDTTTAASVGKRRCLLEIGCGCGDFVLPLLEHDSRQIFSSNNGNCVVENEKSACNPNPNGHRWSIYCCDISDKAIEILKSNPLYKEHSPLRIKAFVADITKEDYKDDVNNCQLNIEDHLNNQLMDVVSLVFVFSSLDPYKMSAAVENVYRVLRPGGLVLFRDYAIYDKAMLRFASESKICDQFYVRQDGTRAYFFSKKQLLKLFAASTGDSSSISSNVGYKFHCESIFYVRRETINRATKDRFSRIFLQAKFRRPLQPEH